MSSGCGFVMDVLRIASDFKYDSLKRWITWRCDGECAPVTFFVERNDLFYWGCADGEELTADNLRVLKQSGDDLYAISQEVAGDDEVSAAVERAGLMCAVPALFCARVRRMRPQGAYYSFVPERAWPLFDACGPEREVGVGNPYVPGEYDRSASDG